MEENKEKELPKKEEVLSQQENTNEKVEGLKVKKSKSKEIPDIVKVKLTKPTEEVKPEVTKVDLTNAKPATEEVVEQPEVEQQPIVEITDEEPVKPQLPPQPDLPEGIQKVVDFMKDTGGDLNDYMNLNRNYEDYGDDDLLRSYYKDTKPHLDDDEINFLVQESFDWDEKIDNERDIKRKKLALKEQVASAKSHLDGLKSKYYEDIKMGSKLPDEAKKAVDFFNRYNKESEELKQAEEQAHSAFKQKTDTVFNDEFKGFEYNVGDKRFRFNVNNAGEIKEKQSDIGNFIGKFLNDNNQIEDAKGYHKALYTAMNSDAIAKHFYEQGKADALKDSVAKSKNIDMNPRESHDNTLTSSGLKIRALGDNSSDFKFKIRKKNK